jgi:AmpD protein
MPQTRPEQTLPNAGPPSWDRGWYAFAARRPSPNFDARPADTKIDLVVVHAISLPPGQYEGHAVEELFTNELDWLTHPYYQSIEGLKVSAHFFVRRNGDLLQFVSCNDRAWHAGVSEHRGRSQCNDFSIGIELEGLDGDVFEAPQYETLTTLCAAIMQNYRLTSITGHEHIAPGRKTDPGAGFDWSVLAKSLALAPQYLPLGTKA